MFFSVVVHGLSVPVLNGIFELLRVPTVRDHPVEIRLLSENEPIPNNSFVNRRGQFVLVNNRFSCTADQNVHPDDNEQPQEESDLVMLRSSGDNQYAESLERTPSKGSSSQVERQTIRGVV